jgi:hypothetical protein
MSAGVNKSWLGVIPMVLCAAVLVGCPPAPEPKQSGEITVVISAGAGELSDLEVAIGSGEKARIVRRDELESLMVDVDSISLERLTEAGSELIEVFTGPLELNLLEPFGLYEIIDVSTLPVGEYVSAELQLSNPRLALADDPGTEITDVALLDDGLLVVPVDFELGEDDEAVLIIELGRVVLSELEDESYLLIADLFVELRLTNVPAQAIGYIESIARDAETFILTKHYAELEVDYTDAVIFLPHDFDEPSGEPEDLEVGQKVFVYGTLDAEGVLHAAVVSILEEEDDDHGDREIKLKFWLDGTRLQPKASGKVEYKAQYEGRRFDLKVLHLDGVARVAVVIDDWLLDVVYVDKGQVRLRLESKYGHDVPRLTPHTEILIMDEELEDILLTSRLHHGDDHWGDDYDDHFDDEDEDDD